MKALIRLDWNKTFKMIKFKIKVWRKRGGMTHWKMKDPKNCS